MRRTWQREAVIRDRMVVGAGLATAAAWMETHVVVGVEKATSCHAEVGRAPRWMGIY
jgi:hypothetical protein